MRILENSADDLAIELGENNVETAATCCNRRTSLGFGLFKKISISVHVGYRTRTEHVALYKMI